MVLLAGYSHDGGMRVLCVYGGVHYARLIRRGECDLANNAWL